MRIDVHSVSFDKFSEVPLQLCVKYVEFSPSVMEPPSFFYIFVSEVKYGHTELLYEIRLRVHCSYGVTSPLLWLQR
jgi:hypothetical protein